MIKKISVKTKLGWISAFENEGRIFKIKFGKVQTQSQSRVLKNFEQNLLKFFRKASPNIKVPYKVEGNQAQRKVWSELKKIKLGRLETSEDFNIKKAKGPKTTVIEGLKITVRALTNKDIEARNLPKNTTGAIITKIENDSPINYLNVNNIIIEAQKKNKLMLLSRRKFLKIEELKLK